MVEGFELELGVEVQPGGIPPWVVRVRLDLVDPGGVAALPKGYSEKRGLEDYQPWQNNATQHLGEVYRAESRQKNRWKF